MLALISIAVVVTLLSVRSLRGAVPGRGPLLGLAVASGRYYAASETGLFVSDDGEAWHKPRMFAGRPALVTGLTPGGAVVLSGGTLYRVEGANLFRPLLEVDGRAMASSGSSLYVAEGHRTLTIVSGDCLSAQSTEVDCRAAGLASTLRIEEGPPEILALDAVPSEPPVVFAGGLRSGVWRSRDPRRGWRRVLQTATRAIMVDDVEPKRIFLGTAGGLLESQDQGRSWSFTGMRQPVEALAQSGKTYFALAGNRLVFQSSDGRSWSSVLTP